MPRYPNVLCRVSNIKPEFVQRCVSWLPKETVTKEDFYTHVQKFNPTFKNNYRQLSLQWGLYYEEDGYCHPRFSHDITKEEAQNYIQIWLHNLVVPNPYSNLTQLKSPENLIVLIVEYMKSHEDQIYLHDIINGACQERVNSSLDILKNTLLLTGLFEFENGDLRFYRISPKVSGEKNISEIPNKSEIEPLLNYFNIGPNLSEELDDVTQSVYGKIKSHEEIESIENIEKVLLVEPVNNIITHFTPNFESIYKDYKHMNEKEYFHLFDNEKINLDISVAQSSFRPYLTALKSKPFLLLAGISGTGKSRIVRELARACWDVDSDEYKAQKPRNFEMVQVKPNWHDSYELFGYVSRVSGKDKFIAGDFLKFVARAWAEPEIPYFLCLDEMNLAPVEQYFAEFLSVVESRKCNNGVVTTDPILRKEDTEWYFDLTASIAPNEEVRNRFQAEGICLPQNLIVVGTVNMDETTFSFSRKVLDRAMTIEMNEVDLHGGLDSRHERIGKLSAAELIGTAVEGVDVYEANRSVCDIALTYLQAVNDILNGTPFKIAYRTRNEFLLYVVNNLPYNKDAEGNDLPQPFVIARALDEITNMKILSRIEGDDTKVNKDWLKKLSDTISDGLKTVDETFPTENSISLKKLNEMKERLELGYTSFWS